MELDKSLVSGSMAMLVLKLLEDGDKYGYQMIEELRRRSDDTFHLRAGTLYPLLHGLEEKGLVTAYEGEAAAGKPRRYYRLTKRGLGALREKEAAQAKSVASDRGFTVQGEGDPAIDALVLQRAEAKKAKNFAEADRIRDELKAQGVEVTDVPGGAVWKRA